MRAWGPRGRVMVWALKPAELLWTQDAIARDITAEILREERAIKHYGRISQYSKAPGVLPGEEWADAYKRQNRSAVDHELAQTFHIYRVRGRNA